MDAVSRRRQGALALKLDRRLFIESPAAGIAPSRSSWSSSATGPSCTSSAAASSSGASSHS
jgi:hypothetical protein